MNKLESIGIGTGIAVVIMGLIIVTGYRIPQPLSKNYVAPRNCPEEVDELNQVAAIANASGRTPGNPIEYGTGNHFHVNPNICIPK